MLKLLVIEILTCFLCDICVALETSQLPLSTKLAETFPETRSNCYIIINTDTGVVLTEKNSQKAIDSGTFREIYGGDSRTTLYEMSSRAQDFKMKFFKSDMSGIGCAYKHKNTNGAAFVCVIYGEQDEDAARSDAKKINDWLEQFFKTKINEDSEDVMIPVIYGTRSEMRMKLSNKHDLLLSNALPKCIKRIYRYRTALKAPITKDTRLGIIMYSTAVFKNPIVKTIYSQEYIHKKPWYKCIFDSIRYIIFGATQYKQRGPK